MHDRDRKREILAKYEREAAEKDNEAWFSKGGTARVPEGKAAHYFIGRKVEEAMRLVSGEVDRSARVLEIGCSFGHMTSLLAARFDALTALDLSPASVSVASKRLAAYGVNNVRFLADDAESLAQIEDGSCDLIVSFSTLRFCPDQDKALRAIRAKLKPDAVAVIDFPNPLSPWHLFIKALSGIKRHVGDQTFSESELAERFARCGLAVEKTRIFLFTTKRLPAALLPFSKLADLVLERIPLINRLGGIIMIKARKR